MLASPNLIFGMPRGAFMENANLEGPPLKGQTSGKTLFVPKIENDGNQPDENSRVKQRLISQLKNAGLLNDDLIMTRLGDGSAT